MPSTFRSVLAVPVVALLLSGSLPGYLASASPGRHSDGYARALHPANAPQTMESSVVVRSNPEVATASENPAAYAADRYVVSFRNDVADPVAAADNLGARLGFVATHIYRRAPKGFAARLSARALAAVRS